YLLYRSISQPARLVRLVQFSKVFISLETTIIFYQISFALSTTFLSFFQKLFCNLIAVVLSSDNYNSLPSLGSLVNNFFKVFSKPLSYQPSLVDSLFSILNTKSIVKGI